MQSNSSSIKTLLLYALLIAGSLTARANTIQKEKELLLYDQSGSMPHSLGAILASQWNESNNTTVKKLHLFAHGKPGSQRRIGRNSYYMLAPK